ncbi:MAG: hypothetical protein U0136_08470 [Bdellovibrionota bacterium]
MKHTPKKRTAKKSKILALLCVCAAALQLTTFAGRAVADENDPHTVTTRQRPGDEPRPTLFPPFTYESIPDINSSASSFVPVPDRWRQFYVGKWYDPYNQNIWKGDLPMFGEPGEEWFVEASLISDTLIERRKTPTPVGFASTHSAESTDVFGNYLQTEFQQYIIPAIAFIRGNTTFKPPEIEIRIVPVINFNEARVEEDGALRADPAKDNSRDDFQLGFQELFLDYHLINLSNRYDFVSSRIGIQKFASDFRGFVFSSEEPGVRLFGNWANNVYQYNLAWFSRLDKDTNSGVNTTFTGRHEQVYVANVYRQDTFALGNQVQGSIIYREDTSASHGTHYDQNGFLVRPAALGDERLKNVYSTYFGLNNDGHFGRINTTGSLYYVTGSESHNPIAERSVDISAEMAAVELSYDIDWIRLRTSAFWASGDPNPYDDKGEGFDSIVDNPNFAGGDLSFFQRNSIPLIGGGGVNIVNRMSLLPDLKAGKSEGQANFVNPGLRLVNLGVDFDVLPELKLISNLSYLQFDEVAVLEALRQDGSISRDIGVDLSLGGIYRPFFSNNVQIHFGGSALVPDEGFKNLVGDKVLYNFFSDFILQY